MNSSNDNRVQLAESVLADCWNEFYGSHLPQHITSASHALYPSSGKINLMDEELDRTVFDTPVKNDLLSLNPQAALFVSYIDENELDLEDELIEPDSQTTEVWHEMSVPDPVPGYTAYTPIQHSVYVRGDLWMDDEGSEFRLQHRSEKTTQDEQKKIRSDREKVRKNRVANAETRGDHAHNQESVAFIPPEFWGVPEDELEFYLEKFHDIESWRDSRVYWDNDEDIIEAATLQRLLFVHKFTPKSIDQTRVLSRKVRHLCRTLQNRTYPNIDAIYPQNAELSPLLIDDLLKPPIPSTPLHMAIDVARTLCHHPDCYSCWLCKVHYPTFHRASRRYPGKKGMGPHYPRFATPKLSVGQIIAQAKRENNAGCDNDCFLSLEASPTADDSNDEIVVHEDEVELPESVLAELELNWKQLPDATPCDIAIFGGGSYTCRQAYQMRNQLFPDTGLESDDSDANGEKKRVKAKAQERKRLPAFEECEHDGPCEEIAGVTPVVNNDKQDVRVPSPQAPTFVGQTDVNASCKEENATLIYARDVVQNVRQTQRAPYIFPIDSLGLDGVPCRNTQLLLQKYKETKVKPSKYGNGLFLVSERAVKGDLIAEYTGEITFERTVDRRDPVYKKTGRNYLFDVDFDGLHYKIDAATAGNESRFMNHPHPGKRANCRALWRYVGGVLRLGIYADKHIFKNEELYLNYGKNFFFPEPGSAVQNEVREAEGSDEMEEMDVMETEEMAGAEQSEGDYEATDSESSSVEL